MVLGTAALLWMLAATGDGGQDRHKRSADTDETVAVSRGTRLALENASGSVEVHTWDRDSLRGTGAPRGGHEGAHPRGPEFGDGARGVARAVTRDPWSTNITAPAWIADQDRGESQRHQH